MLIVYFNDILSMNYKPFEEIDGIKSVVELKGDRAKTLEIYLGSSIAKIEILNSTKS